MGAIAFLILFLLGILVSTVGSLIGIVDAFRVSPVWGLVSLLIPLALLVYCIKFWHRKWARNGFLISLGGLAAMLLSLPLLGSFMARQGGQLGDILGESSPTEGGDPENGAVEVFPVPVPEGEAAPEPEFAEPLVPVAPQLSPNARADLIRSTDPNERIRQVNDGRTDPFGIVTRPPAAVVTPPPPPVAPLTPPATAAPVPGVGGAPVATAPPTPGGGVGATAPGTPGPGTPGQPGALPPLAPLPQLPQPELAEMVQVSGVMTIGNQNFAVVETPVGSQYVRPGQRIANGRVLVKRIDMRGSDPTVVFEENGVEVSRPVGLMVEEEEMALGGGRSGPTGGGSF